MTWKTIWDNPGFTESVKGKYLLRLFIVTYNSPETLHDNLESLFKSNIKNPNFILEIFIINNHPNFKLDPKFEPRVTVLHNVMRTKYSCGHLARDWNTALVRGFESLTNPRAHQVVCAHDDVIWHIDWLEKLLMIHHELGFDLYFGNYGCSLHSYLPSAVKTIGIWDERFCNIGFHEADYMLRALIYNREKSSINDYIQGRVLNPTEALFDHPEEYTPNKTEARNYSSIYHVVSRNMFADKWNVPTERWKENGIFDNTPIAPMSKTYMLYPYFEMEIENLIGKGYSFRTRYQPEWYDETAFSLNVIRVDPHGMFSFIKGTHETFASDWKYLQEQYIPKWKWDESIISFQEPENIPVFQTYNEAEPDAAE